MVCNLNSKQNFMHSACYSTYFWHVPTTSSELNFPIRARWISQIIQWFQEPLSDITSSFQDLIHHTVATERSLMDDLPHNSLKLRFAPQYSPYIPLEPPCHSFHSFISIQPYRRGWQEPEPSHVTGMALAHCILGKFLGVYWENMMQLILIMAAIAQSV